MEIEGFFGIGDQPMVNHHALFGLESDGEGTVEQFELHPTRYVLQRRRNNAAPATPRPSKEMVPGSGARSCSLTDQPFK